jgi:hypothetical protein
MCPIGERDVRLEAGNGVDLTGLRFEIATPGRAWKTDQLPAEPGVSWTSRRW